MPMARGKLRGTCSTSYLRKTKPRPAAADVITTQLVKGILDTKDGADGMAIAAVQEHQPVL
jgi:hypothetical protein